MNTEVNKNLFFFMFGLIISLLVGTYNVFTGLVVFIFVLIRFAFEVFYFKFFVSDKTSHGIGIDKVLPFPFVIIDSGKIIYYNDKYISRFNKVDKVQYIKDLIPNFEMGIRRQKVNFAGSAFILYVSPTYYKNNLKSEVIFFVENFYDIDKPAIKYDPIVVSLIQIDNFDEINETIEEIKKPILPALVDNKISTLSSQVGGIVRKFEKDKYLFLFPMTQLGYLKEKKFDILQTIRAIDLGNKFPITLSIGMGVNENSLVKSMEFAKQAHELSVGRGGDQVCIKDIDKLYFYGGKTKEFDSNTRVRARAKAIAFTELINDARSVIIMGHLNPDLDCIGSAIGVNAIVRAYGKNAKIVLNKVTTSINLAYQRLIEQKEYQHIFITSKKAHDIITSETLLVIVDTHRPSITEDKSLIQKTKRIVIFDHHRKSTEFVDNPILNYHEPYASSTCELITEMLYYTKNNVNLLQVEADVLLSGITVDTKNFAFKTGAKTFEAAAYLRRKGADSTKVRLLFQYKLDAYKAKAVAVNNAEIFNGNIAISICPSNLENPNLVTSQAADDLLNIYGIKASFVFCEENDRILVSARSIDDINVQVIMEKLGGGGHQTVAGAQLSNTTIFDAIESLKDAVNQYTMEGNS